MTAQRNVINKKATTEELLELIIESIQDIKGKNIVKLDLRQIEDAPTNYFIICSGDSNTQIKAIAENIRKEVKDAWGLLPSHVEGKGYARWILVDYFDVVVHIFHPETRAFYELEDLWSDAEFTEYENL